jgi:hypothetical protein
MRAIAAKSSDWPFPATPATPTISPALIEKLTSCSRKADIVQPRAGQLLDL